MIMNLIHKAGVPIKLVTDGALEMHSKDGKDILSKSCIESYCPLFFMVK